MKQRDNRFYPTIDPKSTLISTPHGSMDPKCVRLTAKVVRYWVAFVQCLSLVHSLCNHLLNQEKVELWLWWEPSLISYSLESWPTVWGSWHDLVKNTGYTQTMLIHHWIFNTPPLTPQVNFFFSSHFENFFFSSHWNFFFSSRNIFREVFFS